MKSVPKKRVTLKGNYKHGMTRTPFWNKYNGLQQRVGNKRSPKYNRYGARGIINEWSSFEEFYTDMYKSYVSHVKEHGESNTTLDRRDNDGNYSKENCRWATPLEQAQNTVNTILLTYKGETCCASEWERKLGISRGLIRYHTVKGKTFNQIINKFNYGK